MEELRCYGCGAIIQSEDEKKIGFVPKNALDRSQVLCKRCFRLKNYHQLQATNLSDDDFLEILNKNELLLNLFNSNDMEEVSNVEMD